MSKDPDKVKDLSKVTQTKGIQTQAAESYGGEWDESKFYIITTLIF